MPPRIHRLVVYGLLCLWFFGGCSKKTSRYYMQGERGVVQFCLAQAARKIEPTGEVTASPFGSVTIKIGNRRLHVATERASLRIQGKEVDAYRIAAGYHDGGPYWKPQAKITDRLADELFSTPGVRILEVAEANKNGEVVVIRGTPTFHTFSRATFHSDFREYFAADRERPVRSEAEEQKKTTNE